MAAVMLQVIASFFAECSEKCSFISANTYKKYIVCNDSCVIFHNDKTCSVSHCKFQILLPGNFEELLKKKDTFCLSTRGLAVNTLQVSLQWKKYCKEWTSV